MPEIAIGIDLGGTNVRAGAVTPAGDLLCWESTPIRAADGPAAGIERILALVDNVVRTLPGPASHLVGIGVGSTGPLDRERGAIQNPYTLPGWSDVDILTPLRERFHAPAVLENDADSAALGEAWVGAGCGMQRLAAVTVGTGIGFAFILDGQIYRGMDGVHPEGGHMLIDPAGPECYCGARGCMEILVSGPAIGRFASRAAAEKGGEMLALAGGDPARVDARVMVRAARRGDPVAAGLVAQVAHYLGIGLLNIMLLYLPDGIVLSGGVMEEYDLFAPGVQAVIDRQQGMIPAGRVRILQSGLNGQSGVFGAARAVLNEINHE
jgi:glucokinase